MCKEEVNYSERNEALRENEKKEQTKQKLCSTPKAKKQSSNVTTHVTRMRLILCLITYYSMSHYNSISVFPTTAQY